MASAWSAVINRQGNITGSVLVTGVKGSSDEQSAQTRLILAVSCKNVVSIKIRGMLVVSVVSRDV
jgi:hypothetical protein